MAIIAVLAAIALPSYKNHVLRTKRAEGKAYLLEAVARQERFFSDNNGYASSAAGINYTTLSENGYYQLGITNTPALCDGVLPIAANPCTAYTLTVTPQGNQADDTCKNLSIDSTGLKSVSGSGNCW